MIIVGHSRNIAIFYMYRRSTDNCACSAKRNAKSTISVELQTNLNEGKHTNQCVNTVLINVFDHIFADCDERNPLSLKHQQWNVIKHKSGLFSNFVKPNSYTKV